MRADYLLPPRTGPLKMTMKDICPQTYPNTNQGVDVCDNCFQGWEGQMSDNTWCLGIRVCKDKISCRPQQLNGGCIETALDSNLIGLHSPHTSAATAEHEVGETRRG